MISIANIFIALFVLFYVIMAIISTSHVLRQFSLDQKLREEYLTHEGWFCLLFVACIAMGLVWPYFWVCNLLGSRSK